MSKSRDKRLAVQREDQPLSDRFEELFRQEEIDAIEAAVPMGDKQEINELRNQVAALEAENKRLEYELRVEKGWVRQYRDAYTRLKGDER